MISDESGGGGNSPPKARSNRRPSDELIPDPTVLIDLEAHARSIASGLDMALRDLRGSLRGMSDLTSESMQVFGSVVNSTCDQVDAAIRSTYAMLAKAEEFNQSMQSIQKLIQQIKEIKRFVDLFEAQFATTTSSTSQQ